ncbi:DUF3604 domain-containing protein [Thalassotalea mangrovi]|uniref:DUF3604 domain-containing protein n=1 Tax=Thalassotalea mangrovi TaxID=2572245 RepID=A0A4U1B799_9GAMM|nr:DUF3604 domain-containing protein [Thalassotalea mangrovi]
MSETAQGQERQLLWGDTHLHTSYSIDAYLMGNKDATPATAYRFAKGLPVVHPYSGVKVQLQRPLDFLVVSDHGEYLGIIQKIFAGDPLLMQTEIGRRWKQMQEEGNGRGAYFEAVGHANKGKPAEELQQDKVRASVWSEIVDVAERYNEPGTFTAFVGWEWSSITDGANLHRVILSDANQESGNQFLPYSLFDSDRPEDLWNWLEATSERTGVDFVAIPHNSNISKGLMFPLTDSTGAPIDADYARTRMRWEPVVEVTQIKGDSETHPDLSPDDEFADYEKFEKVMQVGDKDAAPAKEDMAANYVRSALKRGLSVAEKIDANPYKFGLIGSTDAHTALSTATESNFWGKMAIDSTPANTLDANKAVIPPSSTGADMSAAGRAAVWAKENTRESILAAFKRKEVYATTGPRIQLQVFGGFNFQASDASQANLAQIGYRKGTPMGGDMVPAPGDTAPSLLISATMDPLAASLDRVQVIKGWVNDDGQAQEKIFNVAWAGDRQLDADGKLPAISNTVNLNTLQFDNSSGAKRLNKVWTDPEFNPEQRAFYYVRVLQIPTPRHTLYDAVALDVQHPEKYPATIQERAYSSPIWYAPQ